jgi:hypothetical protein
MKSAYELALERNGIESVSKLTSEQKMRIAEVEKIYKAKRAEADIATQSKLRRVGGDLAEIEQIKNDLAVELASIDSKMEQEKEKIRNND